MASRMTTFYGPQVAQVNENPPQESSLDLTLMHYLHDENPKSQEVCPHFEVEPFELGIITFFQILAPW
jgi:hypothetical protein